MRVAAEQILNCSFEAGNRRLYFEGKALEIIACIMENFSTPSGPKPFFNTSDIERIHYARELLTRDFLNPPGLMDLARSVGMHHSKLNQGFKLLFGNTVFGHLTEMRLEEAKHYLESGDMNCAEAALSVGYSSLSHFAKAFNRQYGSNPSSYIKRISAPVRIRRFPMQGNCLKS
ncbi:AraC family transcriptional regulator [Dethiosulfatarculus sandiegensis]|uniref:AraC family transcriptional regulator n=1 Tax=Dethiosulfatarculus sandiegensis TaxID=1429043 RepID=A0A0D2JB42_9BACT|nr:AraC family transcriptional regulator [Dethiosulfatarculus sandiegensis]